MNETAGPATRVPISHRTPGRAGRWLALALLTLGVMTITAAIVFVPSMELENIFKEAHPALEITQFAAWALVPVAGVVGCLRQRTNRGLLLLVWIGVLATLFVLRELDLQVLVNTDNIHHLGLDEEYAFHWRSRWLLEAKTPLWVRFAWIGLLGLIGAIVILPFAFAQYPWPSRLLRLDRFAWTLAASFALLGVSLFIDEISSDYEPRFIDLGIVEEGVEVVASLLALGWTGWLAFGRPNLHVPTDESETG